MSYEWIIEWMKFILVSFGVKGVPNSLCYLEVLRNLNWPGNNGNPGTAPSSIEGFRKYWYLSKLRWHPMSHTPIPIGSMYSIFTYIYHKNQLNASTYTIHGSYWDMVHKIVGVKFFVRHKSTSWVGFILKFKNESLQHVGNVQLR